MTAPVTAPHVRKVQTSLQRQMARAGGVPIADAVARAEQGLEEERGRTLVVLQDKVDALNRLCADRPADADGEVYALASALVDMSGFMEIPPFYAAAYSLCDAAQRMVAADAWSWPEVQVHARALSLILANDCQGGEAVDQMLAGLRAVAEQAVRPG